MSDPAGEFSLKLGGITYARLEGGGVECTTNWEGDATGYGAVFGSLIFPLADGGAPGGTCTWVGQAFPEDSPWVSGVGEGTWQQVEGLNRWTISIPVFEISNGDRIRLEGEVDLETRTFSGKMLDTA